MSSVTNSLLKQSQWFGLQALSAITEAHNREPTQHPRTSIPPLRFPRIPTCSFRVHLKQDLILRIHRHPAFIYEKLLSAPSVNHFTFSQANGF